MTLCETEPFDFSVGGSCNVALCSAVPHRRRLARRLGGLLWLLAVCALAARADDSVIVWPPGWEVQVLDAAPPTAAAAQVNRQRAVKADGNGDPAMVVELTRTPLAADHQVNVSAVLLEMRKAIQVDFSKGGYQSVCTSIHPGTLGNLAAMETTCKVQLNGGHVMTQTLVAATAQGTAWALSYAGSAQGYSDNETAVKSIRDALIFNPQP